jgi:hypothetical protein
VVTYKEVAMPAMWEDDYFIFIFSRDISYFVEIPPLNSMFCFEGVKITNIKIDGFIEDDELEKEILNDILRTNYHRGNNNE